MTLSEINTQIRSLAQQLKQHNVPERVITTILNATKEIDSHIPPMEPMREMWMEWGRIKSLPANYRRTPGIVLKGKLERLSQTEPPTSVKEEISVLATEILKELFHV